MRNWVPSNGTESGFSSLFSRQSRGSPGEPGGGAGAQRPSIRSEPPPLWTCISLAQERVRTSTLGHTWLSVATVRTAVLWAEGSLPRSHKQKAEDLDHCSPGGEFQPDLPQRSGPECCGSWAGTQWADPRSCAQQAQEGLWSRCQPREGLSLRVAVTSPGRGAGRPAADALHLCASS